MSASSPPPHSPPPSPGVNPPRTTRGKSSVRDARRLTPEEYRRRAYTRGPRWVMPVLVALVVLAGVGIAIGYYRNFGSKPINAEVTAFTIKQDSIKLTVDVTRNHPDRAVSCVLNAQARDHGVIGTVTVRLPAGGKNPTVTRTIPTKTRPYAGEVESCSYVTH